MALADKTPDSFLSISDEELMEQIRQKNMEALGELYLRYSRLVSGAIVATVPVLTREEVEDLAQDVFIAVEKASTAYTETGKLKAWLYSVATRVARKRSRSIGIFNRFRKEVSDAFSAVGTVRGGRPDADAIARVDLERAMAKLSPVQRQVLILYTHQGMSGEEIAQILDIPTNTVWSHLKRARDRILSLMAPSQPESNEGRR